MNAAASHAVSTTPIAGVWKRWDFRRLARIAALAAMSVAAFHLAFATFALCWLMAVHLAGLFALRTLPASRQAFYTGLVIGLAVFAPQLSFFWTLFGPSAAVLWLVLAFWHAVFLLALRNVHARFGANGSATLAPVLWMGLEYFRSELYPLKFSWLTVGSAFARDGASPLLAAFGVYGVGFVLMALVSLGSMLWQAVRARRRGPIAAGLTAAALASTLLFARGIPDHTVQTPLVRVAGVQLEFPGLPEVLGALDRLAQQHPDAPLLVLSEYTFDGPMPERVKGWCRAHQRFLVAGGKEPIEERQFQNTAYVIDTNGAVVFQQGKAVPIQFFNDGRPAPAQSVWRSPWGVLGICVCYDLSFSRVTDRLLRQGAQALIVPAMDVETWGARAHALNARMTHVRAAEYHMPLFRVASSGISQCLAADGRALATAPFPGPEAMLAGPLRPAVGGPRVPVDRWLTWPCVVGTALVLARLSLPRLRRSRDNQPLPA